MATTKTTTYLRQNTAKTGSFAYFGDKCFRKSLIMHLWE